MPKTAPPEVVPLSGPTGRLVVARREQLRQVLERHGVRNARIFGSVARGDDHQGSDLDILVDFAPRTSLFTVLRIQDELEAIRSHAERGPLSDSLVSDAVRIRLLEIGEGVCPRSG